MEINKKGFTLIELLAVIVILAIIALIATPIVLNIIKDSKENAQLNSANMYMNAVEQSITKTKMNDTTFNPNTCDIQDNGNLICDKDTNKEKDVTVEVKGETPKSGRITFQEGNVYQIELEYKNNKTVVKDTNGNLVYDDKETGVGTDEEGLASGLYAADGSMTMSWKELIDGGYLFVNNGVLVADTWESGNYTGLAVEGLNDGILIIDKTINEIANYGFYATLIKNVQLPNTINKIGSTAFANTSIEEITLPNTVTVLDGTFYGCYELKIINYNGTKAEWNNIEKSTQILVEENHYQGIDWNEECPQITVHCTDGDIIIPANQ